MTLDIPIAPILPARARETAVALVLRAAARVSRRLDGAVCKPNAIGSAVGSIEDATRMGEAARRPLAALLVPFRSGHAHPLPRAAQPDTIAD